MNSSLFTKVNNSIFWAAFAVFAINFPHYSDEYMILVCHITYNIAISVNAMYQL